MCSLFFGSGEPVPAESLLWEGQLVPVGRFSSGIGSSFLLGFFGSGELVLVGLLQERGARSCWASLGAGSSFPLEGGRGTSREVRKIVPMSLFV